MTDGVRVPPRHCSGGQQLGVLWCGRPATVVVTDRTGMQWFACDDVAHHADGGTTTPIREWFEQIHRETKEMVEP